MYTPMLTDLNSTIANNTLNTSSVDSKDIIRDFKDALGSMKITLDDDILGHFVEKTVADAIYT